jgi:hypothetical protein
MGVTLIGPTSAELPKKILPALIDLKAQWSDNWSFSAELRLVEARCCSSGQDLDRCTFKRRYGLTKEVYEPAFSTKIPWDNLSGWWVRVRMFGAQGPQGVWYGKIYGVARDVHGSTAHGPSGQQTYQAYGPLRILQKISVSTSFWDCGGGQQEIGWMPSINDREGRALIRGNRTANKDTDDDCYLYGGEEVWTHYDYAEYVLKKFVDEEDTDGPTWKLAGSDEVLEALKELKEIIRLGDTQTVADILRRLIPTRLGLDFVVRPTFKPGNPDEEAGFEIYVYALSALEYSFGGKTLPKNPNTVIIQSAQTADNIRTQVHQTDDQGVKTLRVLGKRMVVCTSLAGSEVLSPVTDSLQAAWSTELQTEYEQAAGDEFTDPWIHDHERRKDKYLPVFQLYTIPDDWDFHNGWAAPKLDNEGQLVMTGEAEQMTADHQSQVHRILDWLPLREGVDYTKNPPEEGDEVGEFLPPMVWIGYEGIDWEAIAQQAYEGKENLSGGVEAYCYAPVEKLIQPWGVSLSQTDCGILLNVAPINHAAAKGHINWNTAKPSDYHCIYDYRYLACTIALESDQRLALVYEVPGAGPSDGVRDIMVDDAECWILATFTFVATDDQYHLQLSPPYSVVLRNDADHLAQVMAGAISRYVYGRSRAEIVIQGLAPFCGLLLGQILMVIEEAGSTQEIHTPITAITWQVSDDGDEIPTTTIHAGFAGNE